MSRLLIHVEGQTEETFVNNVLAPHLYGHGYQSVAARLLGDARQRTSRGGIRSWPTVRKEIVSHLMQDPRCLVTTMVDYYGLPQSGDGAWPGRAAAANQPVASKPVSVESEVEAALSAAMGPGFDANRFIAFVMMHEFEAWLFSDCARFGSAIGRPDLASRFQAIRDDLATPEEIDDSPVTAPSKRVENLVPGYQKPLFGTLAIIEIGLDAIRAQCPHFRSWLERLERWPASRAQ